MSQVLTYIRPNKLGLLHDEIIAGGITPEFVEGDGDTITITVGDAVSSVAVDAIVAAHDPNIMSLAEEADEEAEEATSDLSTGYSSTRSRLTSIIVDVDGYTDEELREAVHDLATYMKTLHRFSKKLERL